MSETYAHEVLLPDNVSKNILNPDSFPGLNRINLETGEIKPNRSQQDEIISIVNVWYDPILSRAEKQEREEEVLEGKTRIDVSEETRKDFLKKLASGEITDEILSKTSRVWVNQRLSFMIQKNAIDVPDDLPQRKVATFLQRSSPQISNITTEVYNQMFPKRADNPNYKYDISSPEDRLEMAMSMILTFAGAGENESVRSFPYNHFIINLWEKCPYPNDFDNWEIANRILIAENRHFNLDFKEANLAFLTFRRIVYGKQQEYWEQVKLLKDEARRVSLYEDVDIKTLDKDQPLEILSRTEVHGSPYAGKRLTPEILKQEGMEPRYEITFNENGENVSVYFSDIYDVHGRFAVVGYVPDERNPGKLVTRSYYLSGSQGVVWRYLPNYLDNQEGEMRWFGKGFSEHSINIPIPFQKALAKISNQGEEVKKPQDSELIFAGTARKLVEDGSYLGDVGQLPENLEGNFYANRGSKVKPDQIDFENLDSNPNFNDLVDSWTQRRPNGSFYKVEVYASNNGLLHTIGVRTVKDEEQVWYGMIENPKSKIGVTGLRRKWYMAGDLFTPIVEYPQQAGGYGSDREGNYVSMWENYISKMPWVQRRREARSKF